MENGFVLLLPASKHLGSSARPARNRPVHGTDMSNANHLTREVNCIVERARKRALGIKTIHWQVGISASRERIRSPVVRVCRHQQIAQALFRDAENPSE